jgi:endonuclease V-like protein UPF0215 family
MIISAVDDGYFPSILKGKKGKAPLALVEYENYTLTRVDVNFICIDGEEAKYKLLELNPKGYVILDGVTYAGFNYIEPEDEWIVFYSHMPNINKIEEALLKHFSNDSQRVNTILKIIKNLKQVPTKKGNVYVYSKLNAREVSFLISYYQIFNKTPEPLRTAHIIASAIGKFIYKNYNK